MHDSMSSIFFLSFGAKILSPSQGVNGIDYFDPGVQGEHKIRRGFQPKLDSSFHYFLKNDFGDAVSNFCKSEKKQIENYIEACKSYTPFNKDYKIK